MPCPDLGSGALPFIRYVPYLRRAYRLKYSRKDTFVNQVLTEIAHPKGRFLMDNGQWTMDNGQWTMSNGQ